jgi:hypothetical protein
LLNFGLKCIRRNKKSLALERIHLARLRRHPKRRTHDRTLLSLVVSTTGGQRILTSTSTNGNKNAIAIFFTKLAKWINHFATNAKQ